MSILQYKYKAHRLINTLFYVIVFVIGFLLGFGAKKIDFSKLLSQVLMIDSVSAYTMYEVSDLKIDENYLYDEAEKFNSDFNRQEYNKFICSKEPGWSGHGNINSLLIMCYFFNDDIDNEIVIIGPNDSGYGYATFSINILSMDYYRFEYFFKDDSYSNSNVETPIVFYKFNSDKTNNDLLLLKDIYTNISLSNDYDFVHNVINLEFNENLFKDNPDFKEVCVDSSKYFVISSDEYINNNTIFADFLWFPYGLYGLYQASYSTYENKILYVDDESSTYHYYFSHKDVIDEKFDENSGLKYLLYDNSYYNYDNRYLYYGWTAYPFDVSYSETSVHLPVFYFENPISYSSIGNNIHGGGGTRLEFDEDLEEPIEYCFYIKNNYFIEYLEADEFGDYYGSIIIPDGTLNISSTNNKDDISSGGLMSQVNNFIKQIKDTLNFIRDNIYEFYLSMPLLFRMFLISIFVILIIKFIIGMVVM